MSYCDTMRKTLETQLLKRIDRKRSDVFLRADFADLGGYDQIGRVLRQLVRRGRLMKIGFGLYSRAVKSPFDDKPIPPQGLSTLREALKRVGIETLPSRSMQDYNAGRTTQVPTGRVVGVLRRVRRQIGYNGITLSFERAGPTLR
jgi:hypothetical protein